MVKTPRTRHTKRHRAPLTIELAASEVSPVEEAAKQPADSEEALDKQPFEKRDDAYGDEPASTAPVEEPVEERIETESAATGATRPASDYAFEDTERETVTPVAAAAPRRTGMNSVAAGLIGALVALAGVMGLQWAGLLSIPNATSTGAAPADIAALKDELAALKSAPSTDAGLAASVEQLKRDLAGLQSSLQSGSGGDAAAVAALDAKVKELEGKVTSAGVPADVTEKLSTLESQANAAGETLRQTDGRLAAIENSVSSLSGRVEQQASQPKVAAAIASAALKSAAERGGPFSAELETLAAISPDAPELASLRPFAENGVATEADLTAEFSAAADAMIAAGTPVDENAGLAQRLYDSAKSLVKVRPVGEVAGEDVGARVARMEVAVKAAQYDKAIAEYDGLPEAAKAAGTGYADRLKARLEAVKLIDQLVAGAMKAA